MRKEKYKVLLKVSLLILVILTTSKILFVGYDIDEQYAVALSYRLLKGDFFLIDMWEPHQTSAFVCSLLMYPFLLITKSTTGVILYLRIVGMVIHVLISYALYRYIRNYKDKEYSFLIVMIYFFSLPKLAFLPEFANLQIWLLVSMILLLLNYYRNREKKSSYIYLYLASLLLSLEVLVYPSSILLFPAGIILIVVFRKKNRLLKELTIYIIACVLHGSLFLGLLLTRMDLPTLLKMIKMVVSDGSHSTTILDKVLLNVKSLFEIFIYLLVYIVITVILFIIINCRKLIEDRLITFMNIYLGVAVCGQIYIWVFQNRYPNYPMIEYFLLPLLFLSFVTMRKERITKHIVFFIIYPLVAFIGVILFTNHPILVSAPFLIPTIVGILGYPIEKYKNLKNGNLIFKTMLLVWLIALLFGRVYLVRTTGGIHYTVRNQIVQMNEGPAAKIWADVGTAVQYNETLKLVNEYIEEGSNVFYLGNSNDIYLMKDVNICTPSTISTPTFDANVDSYFVLHPQKKPDYFICQKNLNNEWVNKYIERMCGDNLLAENNSIIIYEGIADE